VDRHDFRIWFERHRICFPDIERWLTRSSSLGRPPGRRAVRILEAWHGVLIDTDRRDAVAATIALFNREEPVPKRFSDHPARVRDIAARISEETAHSDDPSARRPTGGASCDLCGDRGYVFVWHHDDVKRLSRELASAAGSVASVEDPPRLRSMVIYCTCQRNALRGASTPVYTPIRWCLYEEGRLDRLHEWIHQTQESRRATPGAKRRRREKPGRGQRRSVNVSPPAALCRSAS